MRTASVTGFRTSVLPMLISEPWRSIITISSANSSKDGGRGGNLDETSVGRFIGMSIDALAVLVRRLFGLRSGDHIATSLSLPSSSALCDTNFTVGKVLPHDWHQ